jgi:pyruvate/2-oxoglutarate dehydrogenase complex dihydrolipoamide acyltransferase (E2) component
MAKIICVPALGIAIANATINTWFKKEGEEVTQGLALLEVQTDKITMEIPAEVSGTLLKVLHPEGTELAVGDPIAIIGVPGEDITGITPKDPYSSSPSAEMVLDERRTNENENRGSEKVEPRQVLASPLAKRIARENHIDISKIQPSNPRGRITEKDVQMYLERTKISKELEPTAPAIPASTPESKDDEIIPLKGTRKVIADNVAQSAHAAPQYSMQIEIDCTRLVALREKLQEGFLKHAGVELSFMPFIVKAIAKAVPHVPIVNASLGDGCILVHKKVNVGVAVATEDIIYVPVIKEPSDKSLLQVTKELDEYVKLARDNKLNLENISGGTFTITNMGITDIISGTSILHQPQVGIVAIGKIKDRVVPLDGKFVLKPIMIASFTYDHRVVMGVPGGRFAEWVKYYIENPELLLAS